MTGRDQRGSALPVLAIVLLGWVACALAVRESVPLSYNDAVQFVSIGAHLSAGDGYHSSLLYFPDLVRPPLYPLLISLVAFLFHDAVRAAAAVCIGAHLLTIVALVKIHTQIWGSRGRIFTAAAAAVGPNVIWPSLLVSEPVFLCAMAWGLFFSIAAARTGRWREAIAAGGTLALAVLARPEALLTAMGALLLVACARLPLARRGAALLAMVATAACVLVPYGFAVRAQSGRFEILPTARYNLPVSRISRAIAWAPEQADDHQERLLFTLMPDSETLVLDYAFRHPEFDALSVFPLRSPSKRRDDALLNGSIESLRAIASDLAGRHEGLIPPAGMLLLALTAWRCFQALRRKRDSEPDSLDPPREGRPADGPQTAWLAAWLFGLACLHLAPALAAGENYVRRFLAASITLVIPLVGGGAEWLYLRLRGRARWLTDRRLAVGCLALVMGGYALRTESLLAAAAGAGARLSAFTAALLRDVPQGARVLAQRNAYGYLVRGQSIYLPYADRIDQIVAFARGHRADYGIFDEATLRHHSGAGDRQLLDPSAWPAEWKLTATVEESGDRVLIVKLD